MLVKLGNVWVDPTKVIMLEPGMSIAIVTETRSSLSAGEIDNFANIINSAVGQSYGGEDEENPADT